MPKISTNGVTLNYTRQGSGEPLLLVHGVLFGARWWRPQIDALRDRFDVIAPDLRGHQDSETTEDQAGYELWNQSEDIHGLIVALGIAPVHYVGLSLGGFLGMRVALRHPEDIRSLVLIDTTSQPENPEFVERYDGMLQVVEAGEFAAVSPGLPPIFFKDEFVADHGDVVDDWIERLLAADHMGVVRSVRGLNAREDISNRLSEIRVPTLVIHGTEDVAIPMERGEQLARDIPGARLERIHAGHQSNVDTPDEVSRLVRDFLVAVSSAPAAAAPAPS